MLKRAIVASIAVFGLTIGAASSGAMAANVFSGIGVSALDGSAAKGPRLVKPAFSIAGNCEPVDFDHAQVIYNRGTGGYFLKVSGYKRFSNMEVSFSHQSYSRPPAYWETMIVGCWKNFLVVPLPTPYFVTMPLNNFVGTRGVEIVGATRTVRRDVPRS